MYSERIVRCSTEISQAVVSDKTGAMKVNINLLSNYHILTFSDITAVLRLVPSASGSIQDVV